MKKHIFYQKYANLPLEKRWELLDIYSSTGLPRDLNGFFYEIKEIDNKIRDSEDRQEKLLEAVEQFLK